MEEDEDIFNIDLKPFNIEDFKEINDKLIDGKVIVNIPATAILFKVCLKIFD